MTTYTFQQLEELWVQAGGPASVAPTAAAIALAESGGDPLNAYPSHDILPGQGSTTDATGLWQILGLPAGNFTAAELTDPLTNARMAVAKYEQAHYSFSPWQTYTQGTYRSYLPKSGGTSVSSLVSGALAGTPLGPLASAAGLAGGAANGLAESLVPGLSAVENLPGDVGKAVGGVTSWLEYELPLLGLYSLLSILALVLLVLGLNRASGGRVARAGTRVGIAAAA